MLLKIGAIERGQMIAKILSELGDKWAIKIHSAITGIDGKENGVLL